MISYDRFVERCAALTAHRVDQAELRQLQESGHGLFDELVSSGQQELALEVLRLLKGFSAIPDRMRVYEGRTLLKLCPSEEDQDVMVWLLLRFLETGPRKINLTPDESERLVEFIKEYCINHPLLQRQVVQSWLDSR